MQEKYRVATLSRGYGRQSTGYILADENSTAELIGDEPMQMHLKFPEVKVAVCEKRRTGIERLLAESEPPEVILLDDAYQHLAVKGNIQIVLTDYAAPYPTDFPIPAGNLREFSCAAHEANMVVVTKCPPTLSTKEEESIEKRLKLLPKQQCFFSTLCYDTPRPLTDAAQSFTLDENCHIFLFTGIAHPNPLFQYLSSQYTDVKSIAFGDHHSFKEFEIRKICQIVALSHHKTALFTTEKDAARLYGTPLWESLSELPLFAVPVQVKFLWREPSFFGFTPHDA